MSEATTRVLHVNAGNLYGGIETLLRTLARQRGLCAGVGPGFALCFEGRLSDELWAEGVPVHHLGPARVSRPWTIWRTRRRLRALLATGAYDAVVCHACWPHAIAAPEVRRARLPLLFWAHGIPSGRHWLERWAGRHRPDFVLSNSQATQAGLPNLFPGVPGEILYCPVSLPEIHEPAAVRGEVRNALGTMDEAAVILIACRLEPWKGHTLLLQALGTLAGLPGWECWIAGGAQRPGEDRYLAMLGELSRQLGLARRVRFLGQRTYIARLLAAADLYCQPNLGPEPFGIAFVESLYAGLPVVTTALGGALEIVSASCGVLTPPGDVPALADALAILIRNRTVRDRLSRGGPAQARALCDPATQLGRFAQILKRFCRPVSVSRQESMSVPLAI